LTGSAMWTQNHRLTIDWKKIKRPKANKNNMNCYNVYTNTEPYLSIWFVYQLFIIVSKHKWRERKVKNTERIDFKLVRLLLCLLRWIKVDAKWVTHK
jgi:hypothetical protein